MPDCFAVRNVILARGDCVHACSPAKNQKTLALALLSEHKWLEKPANASVWHIPDVSSPFVVCSAGAEPVNGFFSALSTGSHGVDWFLFPNSSRGKVYRAAPAIAQQTNSTIFWLAEW